MKTSLNRNEKRPRKRPRKRTGRTRTALKHRRISRIAGLTSAQLDQFAAWHLRDGLSLQACATRASAEFHRNIPKTSIQRFFAARRIVGDDVDREAGKPTPVPSWSLSSIVRDDFNREAAPKNNQLSIINHQFSDALRAATELNQYAATG